MYIYPGCQHIFTDLNCPCLLHPLSFTHSLHTHSTPTNNNKNKKSTIFLFFHSHMFWSYSDHLTTHIHKHTHTHTHTHVYAIAPSVVRSGSVSLRHQRLLSFSLISAENRPPWRQTLITLTFIYFITISRSVRHW